MTLQVLAGKSLLLKNILGCDYYFFLFPCVEKLSPNALELSASI